MSNSIVGNTGTPQEILSWYEVEVDDDVYEEMEGELIDEESIFALRGIIPKNSNSTTVTIYFYYYAPTSSWYWDYYYGDPYKPLVPVVFAADSNWQLTQCLNASFAEVSFTGQANGWKALNVTLTRKLVQGEKIVFGVYTDLHGYTGTGEVEDPDTTMSYFYWSRAKRRDYASAIAYISSPDYISQQRNIFNDFEICMYLQYENEPDGFLYTRSVLGNVGAAGVFTGRSLGVKRNMVNTAALSDSSLRRLGKVILKTGTAGLSDSVQKLLMILRSCLSSSGASDSLERKAVYKRTFDIFVENEESVNRLGESFRSFEDEVSIDELPFASRLFFRAVETVVSFWDWLRGKIREANNVVTLFCPIATEIELECRI